MTYALGITDILLFPSLTGRLELLLARLELHASSGNKPYTHKGEVAGLVLSGWLVL